MYIKPSESSKMVREIVLNRVKVGEGRCDNEISKGTGRHELWSS